jgi:hypothetical protein
VIYALSALDKATIALAGVTGVLALVALLQLHSTNRSEARRTQPVAVCNRFKPRDAYTKFAVYLTNHGSGTAFNVRFGVRLDGVEYSVGGGRGHRYIVGPSERIPSDPAKYLEVEVSYAPYAMQRGGPDVDSRAVFWARYENAFGIVYETANPVDPLADFSVRRSRAWVRWVRERWQARKRVSLDKIASRRILEEFKVNLDVSKLPMVRKFARRYLRR